MRGRTIDTDGPLHSASLRALMARLHVIGGRRLKALACLLARLGAAAAARRAWPPARAWAMRAGALGVLWAPVARRCSRRRSSRARRSSTRLIVLVCLALGALTDTLLPWPRAPLAPAIAALVALTLDALAGTQLLMRSLLGPDPILGARFYGIGNELKSGARRARARGGRRRALPVRARPPRGAERRGRRGRRARGRSRAPRGSARASAA